MSEFPPFLYSNKAVKSAGNVIAGNMVWTDDTEPQIREAFQVANSWRDSHAFPMRSVRRSVIWHMRNNKLKGITAARLKRMQAIRGKLRRIRLSLYQLQDLGGCRVILNSMADLETLLAGIRASIPHEIWREDDYISNPKKDGYRSHHLIFSYRGRKKAGSSDTTIYNGRRIELQLRTRLQHSWATAIEAVGLFRGEELKNHRGNMAWLRFFELISSEFAAIENCALPENAMPKTDRSREIRRLESELDAISVLDRVSQGVLGPDFPLAPGFEPSHYLISYDQATKTVSVIPYSKPKVATQSYDQAEARDNQTGLNTQNVVLVEVDKIENLRAAYPNYFGDVELFRHHLRAIITGKDVAEFSRVPRQIRKPKVNEAIDVSWLRKNRFKNPENVSKRKKRSSL
jgi:hypothetical protein